MTDPFVLPIRSRLDVEQARRQTRALAAEVGFPAAYAEAIILTVLELTTNLVRYARDGQILVGLVTGDRGTGLVVESIDKGPGILDVGQAVRGGHSSGGGLGGGLSGVRRLMDDFAIATGPDGTHVTAHKWLAH